MSRHEADREDLMRDATALCERVELRLACRAEPVVAGWHRDGRCSIYVGPDPVFHFDAEGRLRRSFSAGDLYRSQGHTLARLRRARSEDSSNLERHDLTPDELEAFLTEMRTRLEELHQELHADQVTVLRETPLGADLSGRLRDFLPCTLSGRLAPALRK